MTGPVFPDVEDTPMFKHRCQELEQYAIQLKDRLGRLVKGAKKFQDAFRGFSQGLSEFSDCLREFCGGVDEESAILGGPLLAQLLPAFDEVAELISEKLVPVFDGVLCDRVEHLWIDELIPNVKGARKEWEKRASDYEEKRVKYLKMARNTKREVIQKSQMEVQTSNELSDEARIELAFALNEIEVRKRHDFISQICTLIREYIQFFGKARGRMVNVATLIDSLLEMSEQKENEGREKTALLTDQIQGYRKTRQERAGQIMAWIARESSLDPPDNGYIPPDEREVSALMEETRAHGGSKVTIIKQGYLQKKTTGSVIQSTGSMIRRYFVLDSTGVLYYLSQKECSAGRTRFANTVNLLTSTIKMDADDPSLRNCFRVVSPERIITLQAETEFERTEWIAYLQMAIENLINQGVELSEVPNKPSRPTHSRQSSLHSQEDMNHLSAENDSGHSSVNAQRYVLPPAESELNVIEGVLRAVAGNEFCVDCEAPDPDWVSLNMGTMMCIHCSGRHRELGVHVSKVRSVRLDVNIWKEPALIRMFQDTGNKMANQIWEYALVGGRHASKGLSWVWLDDKNTDDDLISREMASLLATKDSRVKTENADLARDQEVAAEIPISKPRIDSSERERRDFIEAKYVKRLFIGANQNTLTPDEAIQSASEQLVEAIIENNIKLAYYALVRGAKVIQRVSSVRAMELVTATDLRIQSAPGFSTPRGDGDPGYTSSDSQEMPPMFRTQSIALPGCTALHAACSKGDQSMLELIYQNGVSEIDCVDSYGRTPLHYCMVHDRPEAAKWLMNKSDKLCISGVNKVHLTQVKDKAGKTAFDLAIDRGSIRDKDLFVMLTTE